MCRFLVRVLLLCTVSAGTSSAQEINPQDLAGALALQKVMQKVIVDAEPSVACILVSRSDQYQRPDKAAWQLGLPEPAGNPTNADLLAWNRKYNMADPAYVPQSFGSGVVIDAAGLVLTNYHVVQDATMVYVRLPGGKGSYADFHAADPRSDLAVLKLRSVLQPLRPIAFGNADKVARGHFVLTLANPFAAGFRDGQPSASWGILSNIRRRSLHHLREEERIKPLHYYATLLQTDARLHLGCSGGALLNLHGEMIGLLTSVAALQGGETPGGFAIPINPSMARIIDVLKRGEEVDYGFLGVGFNDRSPENQFRRPAEGVRLDFIAAGSPASLEGRLAKNDVLVAINDQPVRDSEDVFLHVGTHVAGTKVRLQFRRDAKERSAVVSLAKLYVPGKKIFSSLGKRPYFRGLRVDYGSLTAQMPNQPSTIPPGVYVSEVQSESAAERAHLKTGDVITHVNQQPIHLPADFYQAVAGARGQIELTLYNFNQDPPTRIFLK